MLQIASMGIRLSSGGQAKNTDRVLRKCILERNLMKMRPAPSRESLVAVTYAEADSLNVVNISWHRT